MDLCFSYLKIETFLEKSFELYYQEDNTIEVKKENTDPEVPELKNPEDSVEFVPDKLLVQLHSLHIAENADSSSDNEEGNDEDEDVSLTFVIMVKVLFL